MTLAARLLALWPGWVLGVALQLQQAMLWPVLAYAALLAAALLQLALCVVSRRLGWSVVLLAGALAGGGFTGWRAAHFATQALDPALQGLDLEVSGRVAELPQRSAEGWRFVFEVDHAQRLGQPVALPERLQLGWYLRGAVDSGRAPRAGERWRLTVRLRSPHGHANPHGFDRERWLWENGIAATGYVRNGPRDPAPQRLEPAGWGLEAARQAVGERIRERVTDPRSAGVLAALVVGDQGAIDSGFKQ